jgi:phosphoenolpyruvate synthase/pyruvate phosphate dikinase
MIKILFTPQEIRKGQPLPPVAAVGGKGRSLYWLATNGFQVPPTWVFSTTSFDVAVEQAGLVEDVAEIEKTIAGLPDDWAAAQRTVEALEPRRMAVVRALRRAAITNRVGAALTDLPVRPAQWAVRSSATVEDNARYSFAGQFLSLLSVPRGRTLWDAMRQVWASNFRREVLLYCAQHRAPQPRMAVILQPMAPISPQDRSGVAFSHSPVPTLPGVLIQAAFGTGQTVVEGYGGDLYSVQATEVRVQPMPPPHIRITGQTGGTVSEPSPTDPILTQEEARELARLVLAVAERWGGSINVEFVWRAREEPTLVQVRPDTRHPTA